MAEKEKDKYKTSASSQETFYWVDPRYIKVRISKSKLQFWKDLIYGALDGIITTFAVVSGVRGALLAQNIILILGFSNLIADGFSMAIGKFVTC